MMKTPFLILAALAVFVPTAVLAECKRWSEGGIRHSFLVCGKVAVLLDEASKVLWPDTPDEWSKELGASNRLGSGNTVICSFGQVDGKGAQSSAVTRGKKVVWEYTDPRLRAHEVHILTTNGKLGRPVSR